MAIRDILAGEDADNRNAAQAAAQGRSLTGLSGRHTEAEPRFAARDEVFGGAAEPIIGDKVERVRVQQAGPVDDLIGNDPIFRQPIEASQDRKPFGDQEQVLSYPSRPGYRRYWFNDRAGRIVRARQAGYAHVLDTATGDPVARITDSVEGRGRSSYLMEIPIEWYQQDMAKNARILEERLNSIRKGQAGPGADDNRYVPQQGISIVGR